MQINQNPLKSETIRQSVAVIFQYGLIKVLPGVFTLVLFPILVIVLGSEAYGIFSLWLGYAMLIGNVVAGVVTQPMYRYLPTSPDEKTNYHIFSIAAACIAYVICFVILLQLNAPPLMSAGLSAYALGTVLATKITISLIIESRILRLSMFELMRIFSIISVLGASYILRTEFSVSIVVLAFVISQFIPILILGERSKLVIPDRVWLFRRLSFGLKSAVWMLLAGLPIVGAKTILIAQMSGEAFGSYALITDLTYRAFAMLNAVLMMWAFPKLSRHFDCGEVVETKMLLGRTFFLYVLAGATFMSGLLGGYWLELLDVEALPNGGLAIVFVTISSFLWHSMSIAHKVLEMRQMTIHMVWLMAIGVAIFFAFGYGFVSFPGVGSFYTVNLAMIGVALLYSGICLRVGLGR